MGLFEDYLDFYFLKKLPSLESLVNEIFWFAKMVRITHLDQPSFIY